MAAHVVSSNRRQPSQGHPGVAALMALVAASLGVAAGLHLSGSLHGRSPSFDPDAAGTAEAVIGVVLAVSAIAMIRLPRRARAIGMAALSFSLVGFLVGIIETARGGATPDIAYHATVIPFLIGGLVLLARSKKGSPDPLPTTLRAVPSVGPRRWTPGAQRTKMVPPPRVREHERMIGNGQGV